MKAHFVAALFVEDLPGLLLLNFASHGNQEMNNLTRGAKSGNNVVDK